MARYGIYVDVMRCIGCYSCIVGCKNWHQIEAGVGNRVKVIDIVTDSYPNVSRWIFPIFCMQCENAPCVEVCPAEATYKRKDGIVVIVEEKCVGCKSCIDACPYNLRYFDEEKKKADKCDFCKERIDEGLDPYCVEICPGNALVFGDLSNSDSEISKLIKSQITKTLLSEQNTKPSVYFANMDIDDKIEKKLKTIFLQ